MKLYLFIALVGASATHLRKGNDTSGCTFLINCMNVCCPAPIGDPYYEPSWSKTAASMSKPWENKVADSVTKQTGMPKGGFGSIDPNAGQFLPGAKSAVPAEAAKTPAAKTDAKTEDDEGEEKTKATAIVDKVKSAGKLVEMAADSGKKALKHHRQSSEKLVGFLEVESSKNQNQWLYDNCLCDDDQLKQLKECRIC